MYAMRELLHRVGYPVQCFTCSLIAAPQASAEIMRLLSQMCPGCLLEKASIDEAYLDITPMAVSTLVLGGCSKVACCALLLPAAQQVPEARVDGEHPADCWAAT